MSTNNLETEPEASCLRAKHEQSSVKLVVVHAIPLLIL